jgi:arylsulfatase A-like enzyme/Flp pilus assembly protein TadD
LGSCAQPRSLERTANRHDLILVTIDTLRFDRVGVDGGPGDVTPTIDQLGKDGVVFLDATAQAPLTLPSHASILTGRYPPGHGVHDNAGFTLPVTIPTLATVLRAAGYHTAAFVSSFVLRGSTGLSRGFDVYNDRFEGAGRSRLALSSLERRGPAVARDVSEWLASSSGPRFVWVHFYDPHAPYDAPEAFAARFPGRPYDAEVATADFALSQVLAGLSPERRADTLVALTGDHGESLGEHGESEHGILLYDATLHVPLILQGPGVPHGVSVKRQARHVDLLPTLTELLGVPTPSTVDGVSLSPLWKAAPLELTGDAPLSYAESRFGELHFGWSPLRSARDGRWKFIAGPDPELFDLKDDPGERANLSVARSDTAAGLSRALESLVPAEAARALDTPAAPDAETAARLRSLGYVSGHVSLGKPSGAAPGDSAPSDPKRQIARYEAYVAAFNAGMNQLDEGRAADAEATFRRLARDFPQAFEPHQYLGRALAARGALAAAIAEIDIAIGLSGRSSVLYFDAARVLADARHFDRALARVERGRALEPDSFYGALTEGLVARAAGQPLRAAKAYRDAIRLNPSLGVAHLELGRIAEAAGDRDAARREYRAAIEGDPSLKDARQALDQLDAGDRGGR